MDGVRLSIGDAVGFAWQTAKQHVGLTMSLGLVAILVPLVPSLIADELEKTGGALAAASSVFGLVSLVLSVIVGLGMIRVSLTFARGEQPAVVDLFRSYQFFWRYLGATVLFALAVLAGLILLIVPGVILALRYGQYGYFIVEQNLGPVAALKASAQVTRGAKGSLFSLYLTLGLINFAGALALLVGYLFTYPLTSIAMAYAYRVLTAQVPASQAFAASTLPPAGV